MVPFPSPCWKHQGDSYCENLAKLLEVRLTELRGPLYEWIYLEILALRLAHIEPPTVCQFQCRSPYSSTGSQGGFCL